ncbi:uncharacterized protein LOC132249363 [Alligator mississippiensis]|uniref:uncharacterized protein LOC132249363 n=1 Tax=Alligator mississippiensis TaxID=8496 RepID=UPI002877954A|nr:uncharacterized protein LOC132249363 [Alligator mississippiensis]
MQVGGELIDFLVDSGATHSVVTNFKGPLSKTKIPIIGATGQRTYRPFVPPMECKLGGKKVSHQFLYMPECRIPLFGRDLLCKLQAQLTFSEGNITMKIPTEEAWKSQVCLLLQEGEEGRIPPEVEDAVVPWVWAGEKPGRAKLATPVSIDLKLGITPPMVPQYQLKIEAWKGLEPLIKRFLKYGLLQECQSSFNSPILPVKKPHSNEYRFVQDLRAVNKVTVTLHPLHFDDISVIFKLRGGTQVVLTML